MTKNLFLSVGALLGFLVLPVFASASVNINVTAPVGGAVWPVGVTQSIRWVAPQGVPTVDIVLMRYACNGDQSDCNIVEPIIIGDNVPNDGAFDFQPRPGFATSTSDKYKVEVRAGDVSGENDGYISITNPGNISMGRDVTVLSPNTNADVWKVGQASLIKWRTAVPGGTVTIALRDVRDLNNIKERNIAVDVPNAGKFMYTVPVELGNLGRLDGKNYRVVVYHRNGTVSDATDGIFTIETPNVIREVTVTNPNSNAHSWQVGDSERIAWDTRTPGGLITIALMDVSDTNNVLETVLATNIADTGMFDYIVPESTTELGALSGQKYKIKVTRTEGVNVDSDSSDGAFTIWPLNTN